MEIQTPKMEVVMLEIRCDVFGQDEEHPTWCACRGTGVFTISITVPEKTEQEVGQENLP